MDDPRVDDLRPGWARLHPQRWRRELEELTAAGWPVQVREHHNEVLLEIDYPLPTPSHPGIHHATHTSSAPTGIAYEPAALRLEVTFPPEYPFFPPHVRDRDNPLGLLRHRNQLGTLCLVEDADWHPDTTLARLLGRQLPPLVEAGLSPTPPADGVEVQSPEPVQHAVRHARGEPALIMPTTPIPADADQGALVVRYAVKPDGTLGAGLVERILLEQLQLPGPAPALEPAFSLVTFGRWARDPQFDPTDPPERTWQRLTSLLEPLQVERLDPSPSRAHTKILPDRIETICLLVPSESAYRQPGQAWVALLRVTAADGTFHYRHLPVQLLGPGAYAPRSPQSQHLAQRHVVLVGVGALGGHVAVDLSRAGVGRIDVVDGDVVDVATATRQYAPVFAAGRPKVEALISHLSLAQPDAHLRGLDLHLGAGTDHDSWRPARLALHTALHAADLVVDATAAPAVTRYLAAVRHAQNSPFLHVSATAGAWGGCVFLTRAGGGCWACLQHHRLDRALPIPPADPAGLITPPGCAEPTFTGTNPDLATIAHHASRVAIAHLTGQGSLGGDLHVAHLRDPGGAPTPVRWDSARVPIHPLCPLHDGHPAAAPATDRTTGPRTWSGNTARQGRR